MGHLTSKILCLLATGEVSNISLLRTRFLTIAIFSDIRVPARNGVEPPSRPSGGKNPSRIEKSQNETEFGFFLDGQILPENRNFREFEPESLLRGSKRKKSPWSLRDPPLQGRMKGGPLRSANPAWVGGGNFFAFSVSADFEPKILPNHKVTKVARRKFPFVGICRRSHARIMALCAIDAPFRSVLA